MAFLEDPRLRQRWNQIAHDAGEVTENAAAGIWSFQHHYINPCVASLSDSIEQCTTVCLGDPDERLRRRRERDRAAGAAEYSFDFYDDWYEEEHGSGLFGSWGNEDWDRLLAGTGSQRRHTGGGSGGGSGETSEQPRRKRGMSYGTRGVARRKTNENDPTIIPSTQPIGFLSKLPFRMGGTLRYKPSAADLQDHPNRHGGGGGEGEPLLGSDDESDLGDLPVPRKRSGTTGSGDTSDSYRSRGDLFPSDGEGEEDAVPLDDDVTYDMVRKDDRSSGRSGWSSGGGEASSKGKRPASRLAGSRTVSRTTLVSVASRDSLQPSHRSGSQPDMSDIERVLSLDDLAMEERLLQQAEDEEVARKKAAAAQLAAEKGLASPSPVHQQREQQQQQQQQQLARVPKPIVAEDEHYEVPIEDTMTGMRPEAGDGPEQAEIIKGHEQQQQQTPQQPTDAKRSEDSTGFVPARLPHFG